MVGRLFCCWVEWTWVGGNHTHVSTPHPHEPAPLTGTPHPTHTHTLQETPLAILAGPGHLFRSEHIEERVALGAVLRPCSVRLLPPGPRQAEEQQRWQAEGGGGGGDGYLCLCHLDHQRMTLEALLPLSGGGGVTNDDSVQ